VRVESREDIIKRLGRSPDWASAYVLALIDTPKFQTRAVSAEHRAKRSKGHDPFEYMHRTRP
jgi:hypothetical protein